MTKKELEKIIKLTKKELENAIQESHKATMSYSNGGEYNYAFQTGYLTSRINLAMLILNEVK